MSLTRAAVVLLFAALLAYLPGLMSAEWRGTEGRRVQIAVEMLERAADPELGTDAGRAWMVPTLGWEDTLAKPPLYYWLLAWTIDTFHLERWAVRLPSVLGIWAVAVLAFALLRRLFAPQEWRPAMERGLPSPDATAWVGALGIITSPVLLHDGPYAEIDPLFASVTAASLMVLAWAIAWPRRSTAVLAGVLGGIALMVKGPPYFMFLIPVLFVWWRRRRMAGLMFFTVPLLLIPGAYYAHLLSSYVDLATFGSVAGEESVGRLVRFEWRHVLATPTYLLRAVGVLLPLGFWTFYEYRSARLAHVGRRDLVLRVCKSAALGGALILAVFPGKSTRYLLPMVPLFILAVAPGAAAWASKTTPMRASVQRLLHVVGMAGAVALVLMPFLPTPMPGRTAALMAAFALAPLFIKNRRHVVIACLALPVFTAWTTFVDREEYRSDGLRGIARNAEYLHGELEKRDLLPLREGRVATWGHMNSGLLLDVGGIPPGDELLRDPPVSSWLLMEQIRLPQDDSQLELTRAGLEGYRTELRIRWRDRDWVLLERRL